MQLRVNIYTDTKVLLHLNGTLTHETKILNVLDKLVCFTEMRVSFANISSFQYDDKEGVIAATALYIYMDTKMLRSLNCARPWKYNTVCLLWNTLIIG